MKKAILIITGLLFLWPVEVLADQPIYMVRTLCMNELGHPYFSAHLESFAEMASYRRAGRGDKTNLETRMALLKEKYGLLSADDFDYTCDTDLKKYRVYGERPPLRERGMCGGNPRTKITLEQGSKKLLDNVFAEQNCFDDPSVFIKSIEINDEVRGWGGGGNLLKISEGKSDKELFVFSIDPINQTDLDCLHKNGFFESNVKEKEIKIACLGTP